MRTRPIILALALVPGLVSAQGGVDPFLQKPPPQPRESGVSIGVSGAYAIPMGSISGVAGDDLSLLFSHAIPLQLDLGYRFNPALYLGAYFQYAFASTGSSLDGPCNASGISCSASYLRFGLEFRYTFPTRSTVLPWVGIGTGYEIAKIGMTASGQSVDLANVKGFEFAHLAAGVDFRVSPLFRVGPFAAITFAQYSTVDSQVDTSTNPPTIGPSRSQDISNKALHEWLQLGLKATFDL